MTSEPTSPKTRRRWYRALTTGLLVVVVAWLLGVALLAIAIQRYGEVDRAQPADVIIVLGSGLNPDDSPGPSLWLRSRHGARLYQQGYADTIICTGAQAPDRNRTEADGCREVLMRYGVPRAAIILEEISRSTEENAIEAGAIMRARDMQTALVVSQGYHLLRSHFLFSKYNIEHSLSPVPDDRRPRSGEILREILAFHWQIIKDALGLPFTHVP